MDEHDYQELLKRKARGLITIRKHPIVDLEICNYTHKTQYDKDWDDYITICRGLILDKNHKVVARPFPKFFNLGETPETIIQNLPNEVPTITEKLDGVMGILFNEGGKVTIATRGTFESEYAIWATEWIRNKGLSIEDLESGYTYCFEIIYPASRIVVDYKGRAELVLLAVLDIDGGPELNHVEEAKRLGLSYAREFKFNNISEAENYLKNTKGTEQEGFVCKYSNGLRIKLKSEDYFKLHKCISGISEHSVWESLSQGKTLDGLIGIIPDELYEFVKKTESELLVSKAVMMDCALGIFEATNQLESRKEQAKYVLDATKTHGRLGSVIFSLLDGNKEEGEKTIWKMVEPKRKKEEEKK